MVAPARTLRPWARLAVGVVALTLCAGHARAGDDEDDVQFALRLAARGYTELAQAEIDNMLTRNPSAKQREAAEFARCELLRRAALTLAGIDKSDPAEVRQRFDAARKAYAAFLKAFPGGAHGADAEFNGANLLKDFGYYLNKKIADLPNPEEVRKEAEGAFDEAIRLLKLVRDRENTKGRAGDPDDELRFQLRNVAWYYLCVAMHDRALLHPVGDALRTAGLTKTIDDELMPFLEETDGEIVGYYVAQWLGRSFGRRAEGKGTWNATDLKDAKDWFDVAIGAADLPGAKTILALSNVVFESCREFGALCNQVGSLDSVSYPRLYVETMQRVEKALPQRTRSTRYGLEALVEKARALARTGQHEAAIREINAITQSAGQADPSWGRGVSYVAKQALNDVIASIPPDANIRLSPDVLFKAGEGSGDARQYGRAIRAFQRTLLACEEEPDPARQKRLLDEYHAKTWSSIFYCYMQLDRYREAYVAADQAVKRYLAMKRADEDEDIRRAALGLHSSLQALGQRTRDKEIIAEAERAREFLTREPALAWVAGGGLKYIEARAAMDRAASLQRQERAEEAAAAFQEAIALLKAIPESEAQHRTAQSRIGECLVLMGKPEDAAKHIEGFLAKWASYFNDANTPPPQRQPQGWGTFWLANARFDLGRHDRVVEALKDFETRFAGAGLDNALPRIRFLRVRSLLELKGRLAEAEKEALALKDGTPDSPWTASACLGVANALVNERAAAAEQDPQVAKEMLGRAVDLYDFWIASAEAAGPEMHVYVGKMNQEAGRLDRASAEFEIALKQHEAAGDKEAAETVRVHLVDILIDQQRYEDALPKLERLFVKPQTDLSSVREFLKVISAPPPGTEASVYQGEVKKFLAAAVARASLLPAGAPLKARAEGVVASANPDKEDLMRVYDGAGPDGITALAAGLALTKLGESSTMSPNVRNATFELVKRTPDLMYSLARCHEARATKIESAISAVNLYQLLIESAPVSDEEKKPEGTKYSGRWFEWRLHHMGIYRTLGVALKADGPLRTVCALFKSMATLDEVTKADKVKPGLRKQFEQVRDEADAALRRLGKDGCE